MVPTMTSGKIRYWNLKVDECKTRWRTIRDSYKKVNKKKMTGSITPAKSKYNSDILKFLDNPLPKRWSRSTVREDDTEPAESLNNAQDSKNEVERINNSNEDNKMIKTENAGDSLDEHESTCDSSSRQNAQSENNGYEPSEKKRRKVVSEGEKLLDISKGCEERLHIVKKVVDKEEIIETNNPVFTFFKSMAQTVVQLPPHIIAETRVKICQLVAEMEAKAMHEQN